MDSVNVPDTLKKMVEILRTMYPMGCADMYTFHKMRKEVLTIYGDDIPFVTVNHRERKKAFNSAEKNELIKLYESLKDVEISHKWFYYYTSFGSKLHLILK